MSDTTQFPYTSFPDVLTAQSVAEHSVPQPSDHIHSDSAMQVPAGQPAPPPMDSGAQHQQQALHQQQTQSSATQPESVQPPEAPQTNGSAPEAQPSQPTNPSEPAAAGISTAANPASPFVAINAAQPATAAPEPQPYAPPAYIQRPGGSRFIPYQPPAGQPPPSGVPQGPRQAIIAPPVKNPPKRKRTVKTSEFVEDDGRQDESISQGPSTVVAAGQEQQSEKENGVSANDTASQVKKRPQDTVKAADYIKPHVSSSSCQRRPMC